VAAAGLPGSKEVSALVITLPTEALRRQIPGRRSRVRRGGRAGKKHPVLRGGSYSRRCAVSEQQTESAIKVRQVTDVHANWSSQGSLENGKFSYQLILDNGAQEALIMPTVDDAKVLRDLIHDADTIFWDLDKEVMIFGKID
jgi:hypothetical protein